MAGDDWKKRERVKFAAQIKPRMAKTTVSSFLQRRIPIIFSIRGEETVKPGDDVTADILKSDCGRLLAVSKERLFLIRPARGASALDLDTFILSSKKAEALRIRADYTSCP